MLAYLFWHRPAPTVDIAAYEQALEQFHRSLAHRPPSGFRGSATLRAGELPWLAGEGRAEGGRGGYEDWYLLDDWAAVGVLEEAAVSRGHVSAHDRVASLVELTGGAIYRLIEGRPGLDARLAVWVTRSRGHEDPSLAALLGDGMDPAAGGLWRRCLALGPAPEFCLLAPEAPAGVAATRLPRGWSATSASRHRVGS